jgi:hypothetical protein
MFRSRAGLSSDRVMSRVVRASAALVVAVGLIACTGTPPASVRNLNLTPEHIAVPAAEYYGIAWADASTLALVSSAAGSAPQPITVVPIDGSPTSVHDVAAATCQVRNLAGFSTRPDGTLGFADSCDNGGATSPGADLVAVAWPGWQTAKVGGSSLQPSQIAWRPDSQSAVLTIGTSPCETLYDSRTNRPLSTTVSIDAHSVSIGEDVAARADACTADARSAYAAFAPGGGSLAFLISRVAGTAGQDRIDLPWQLFVLDAAGRPTKVLGGLRHPRGVAWIDDATLVIAATLNGSNGLWLIRSDGSNLEQLSDAALDWLAMSPDRTMIAGIPALPIGSFVSQEAALVKLPRA